MAPPTLKLWASLPVSHLTFGGGSGGIMMGGGSLQLALGELWALEAGGAAVFTGVGSVSPDILIRAGVTPIFRDSRDPSGRGWTTQIVALAGYWYTKRSGNPDGHYGTETTHALRANAGFDFTRHASPIDFSVRLLSGVALPISQTRTGDWLSHLYIEPEHDMKYALDVGLDLGLGF